MSVLETTTLSTVADEGVQLFEKARNILVMRNNEKPDRLFIHINYLSSLDGNHCYVPHIVDTTASLEEQIQYLLMDIRNVMSKQDIKVSGINLTIG